MRGKPVEERVVNLPKNSVLRDWRDVIDMNPPKVGPITEETKKVTEKYAYIADRDRD